MLASRLKGRQMQLGIGLPQDGALASPQNIVQIAQEAERLEYASVWVYEHLLRPTHPTRGVLGGEPEMQSEFYASTYDPLETLAYVAAKTHHIKLGTSVINALFHPPLILARRFATLDQLSGGRVIAGLGQGWMDEEFQAVNVPKKRRGAGMEEYVQVLRAIWGPDPVSFNGRFYTIPESQIGPKPVQSDGIPIIFGAFAPAALERAARIADGINPGNFPLPFLTQIIQNFHINATAAGRDLQRLQIIVRVVESKRPGPPRQPLIGSIQEISEDIIHLQELGVQHVIFDLNLNQTPILEQLRFLAQLRAAVPL